MDAFNQSTELLGRKLEDMFPLLKASNKKFRVIHRDGVDFIVTQDLCPERINISVRDGVIFKVTMG